MKFAYADPPYLGASRRFYGAGKRGRTAGGGFHPDAEAFDRIETHAALIDRLSAEFDAWALSLSSRTLARILPLCPEGVRIGAWVKPNPVMRAQWRCTYAWEPVIFRTTRRHTRNVWDHCVATLDVHIKLKDKCPGAKPAPFCWWIFDLLAAEPDDEFHDLFPGSGAVGRAWAQWCRVHRGFPLFEKVELEGRT